ncbi:MAG: DUF4870 domain-containing protein [Planctomycetes bacterium]|nr:DUF4870 domain-containing protein [Planctomycetota bacterium]
MTMSPSHEIPTGPPAENEIPPDLPSKEARGWAMAAHLTALSGFIGVPFGNIIGPLVVWLIKKDEMPYVDDQGKEALNFQITALIVFIVLGVMSIIPLVFCVTIPLIAALGIVVLVLTIIAGVQANTGRAYRYPFSWRFIN